MMARLLPNRPQWELMRELSLLEVDENVPGRPFDTLSSGERTKVLLAVMFLKENRFLLIDEPTNHLDMNGRKGDLSVFAGQNDIDESLFKAILSKLDFSKPQFDKDMRDFSSGQKKKVLIAKSLCEKAHLLAWDEPLNFIDVISRMQIESLLLEYKPTILFVEHDDVFRNRIATETVLLGTA